MHRQKAVSTRRFPLAPVEAHISFPALRGGMQTSRARARARPSLRGRSKAGGAVMQAGTARARPSGFWRPIDRWWVFLRWPPRPPPAAPALPNPRHRSVERAARAKKMERHGNASSRLPSPLPPGSSVPPARKKCVSAQTWQSPTVALVLASTLLQISEEGGVQH